MVELANTDPHEHAMMVVFMHAPAAFIAMPHSDPLIQPTNLAGTFLIEATVDLDVAVLLVAK